MAKEKRSGPLNETEQTFIRLNKDAMSPTDIALKLNRGVETVVKYIDQMDSTGTKHDIINLKKRHDWKVIQSQLSPSECELFEWHWNNIIKQFKDEIFHTEGLQVVAAIKHEILANRMLTDQRKIIMMIERLEKELEEELKTEYRDKVRIGDIEKQIAMLSAAQEANNREFRENSKKLSEILQALRATRTQRVEKLDASSKSFTAWMRRILEDNVYKRDVGQYCEKMRLAKDKEFLRLGAVHKFNNGEFDRCILSCDTVDLNEEEDNDTEIVEVG